MSMSVGNLVRNLAADGYFGKRDLQTAVDNMLDGRGITHREKRAFTEAYEGVISDGSVYVTDTANRSYNRLLMRTNNYSHNTRTYGNTLDTAEVKDILSEYTEGRRVYSGGESPVMTRMGGRAEPRPARERVPASEPVRVTRRAWTGGE